MSNATKHAALFAGRWIGETQGYDAPAHVWEIAQNGANLTIDTRWETETRGMRGDAAREVTRRRAGKGREAELDGARGGH